MVLFLGGVSHCDKNGEGDDYSVLQTTVAVGYDPSNDDYSHLSPTSDRGSPPPPPPPVRHSSKQSNHNAGETNGVGPWMLHCLIMTVSTKS